MDAITGRISGVISKSLTWSRDVLLAVRVVRVPLMVSLAAAVFLGFVPQIIEIYNIMVQQVVEHAVTKGTLLIVLLSTMLLVLLSMLPFLLMSCVIWYVTQRLVDVSRNNPMKPWNAQGPYDAVLEWAPGGVATLPMFAAAYGMYKAPKIGVSPEILSAYGTSALDRFSIPDLATLLATDGVLHSAMHVVLATALLLLLAFGALRPGRVHSPFKPHWAVQTLIWVCAAVVAVLYILVPVLETPAKFLQSSDFQGNWPLISPEIDHSDIHPDIKGLLAQSLTSVGTVFTFLLKYWAWLKGTSNNSPFRFGPAAHAAR